VAGWSSAEQDLAATAAAALAAENAADRDGWGDRAGSADSAGRGDRAELGDGNDGSRRDKESGRDGGAGWGGRDGMAGLRAQIRAGEDPLGQAFCRIRPPEQRRGAGQTFTPAGVVDSMISWAGRALTPARVVDPGAGSARFLAAAGRRWPEAELIGLETDPLAALIGRPRWQPPGWARRSRWPTTAQCACLPPRPHLVLGSPRTCGTIRWPRRGRTVP
jgi:hypothetical protein